MRVVEFLVANGAVLALGASAVLALGCLAMWFARAPVERRRLGVWTGAALCLYLVAAAVPLPRLPLSGVSAGASPGTPTDAPRTASTPAPIRTEVVPTRPLAMELATPSPTGTTPAAPTLAATGRIEIPMSSQPVVAADAAGRLLAIAFLLGAATTAAWLLLGCVRLRSLRRRCVPAPAWLAAGAGVPVLVTAGRTRAFCAGAWRPFVVLPRHLIEPTRADAARAVLAHELAHIRAGDCRVQALFALLFPLCFWQPMFWWLRARVRFCAELLADDAAAQASSVRGYVRELLTLAEAGDARVAHAGALSVFHRPSEFYERIQMLLAREVPLSRSVSLRRRLASAVGAITLVALTASLCGVATAQAPPEGEAAQTTELRTQVRELRAEVEALRQLLADRGAPPKDGQDLVTVQPSLQGLGSTQDPRSARETYVVQKGDTLVKIATSLFGSAAAIERVLAANPGLDPTALRPGQRLIVPVDPRVARKAGTPATDVAPTLDPLTLPPIEGVAASARSLTQLLDIVSRGIELRGAVEIAEMELAQIVEATQQGVAQKHAAHIAEIKARTARQQLELTERLLESELAHAKAEVQRLEKLRAAGFVPAHDANLRTAATFVEVLKGFF